MVWTLRRTKLRIRLDEKCDVGSGFEKGASIDPYPYARRMFRCIRILNLVHFLGSLYCSAWFSASVFGKKRNSQATFRVCGLWRQLKSMGAFIALERYRTKREVNEQIREKLNIEIEMYLWNINRDWKNRNVIFWEKANIIVVSRKIEIRKEKRKVFIVGIFFLILLWNACRIQIVFFTFAGGALSSLDCTAFNIYIYSSWLLQETQYSDPPQAVLRPLLRVQCMRLSPATPVLLSIHSTKLSWIW